MNPILFSPDHINDNTQKEPIIKNSEQEHSDIQTKSKHNTISNTTVKTHNNKKKKNKYKSRHVITIDTSDI